MNDCNVLRGVSEDQLRDPGSNAKPVGRKEMRRMSWLMNRVAASRHNITDEQLERFGKHPTGPILPAQCVWAKRLWVDSSVIPIEIISLSATSDGKSLIMGMNAKNQLCAYTDEMPKIQLLGPDISKYERYRFRTVKADFSNLIVLLNLWDVGEKGTSYLFKQGRVALEYDGLMDAVLVGGDTILVEQVSEDGSTTTLYKASATSDAIELELVRSAPERIGHFAEFRDGRIFIQWITEDRFEVRDLEGNLHIRYPKSDAVVGIGEYDRGEIAIIVQTADAIRLVQQDRGAPITEFNARGSDYFLRNVTFLAAWQAFGRSKKEDGLSNMFPAYAFQARSERDDMYRWVFHSTFEPPFHLISNVVEGEHGNLCYYGLVYEKEIGSPSCGNAILCKMVRKRPF